MPPKGNIAFMSQSGALCTAVLDWAVSEHVGFSSIISLGNMADMTETSFIELLAEDDNTKVILVYVEEIKEGRRFLSVAPKVSSKKPLIFLKSGTSDAGARAAASHTGSIAGSEIAYKETFRKCGVLRARSVEELFNLGMAFSSQPIPKGRNTAIITNAGGPSIIAADASSQYGLNLTWLSSKTVEILRKNLPPEATWFNPVDLLGDASADRYGFALETILADGSMDSVIVILTPQAMTRPLEIAEKIKAMKSSFPNKPIITVFMGGERIREAVKILMEAKIPNYQQPDKAVSSLAGMVQYREYISREPKMHPSFKVNRSTVSRILERLKRERRVNLLSVEAKEVVQAYGIAVPSNELAQNRTQAVEAAEQIGYPIVMKVVSPQILHKTDIGGVKLNLKSKEEVETAFNEIMRNANLFMPEARVFGIEVQKMAPVGKEMIVGMNRDIRFGPLVMFGLGGIYVNVLRDVSFRLTPISRRTASEMITETKSYALLRGVRGEPSSDIESIIDVILRISQLSSDFKDINEIDINPLFVYERGKGSLALDVKMTITHT
jgi:acetyltransferase